jgi:hypothetical protein
VKPSKLAIGIGAVVGAALAAVGVVSLLDESRDTHPPVAIRWVLGLALAHDLLLVPLVLAIGVAVRRWVPGSVRPFVAGGLVVSGATVLFAWPFVRGYGRLRNHPSLLPRNYAHGLVVTLTAVWLVVAIAGLLAVMRRRRRL